MPREIDLREVRWLTITPENYEEQFAIIEAQEGELVFLAMTIPDYETMAYNMQELKRYITCRRRRRRRGLQRLWQRRT